MAVSKININADSELGEKVQLILDDFGLDISTAVNIFFKQIVYKEAIPFEINKTKIVNKKQAKLGGWEGKIFMSPDFNEPMEEFKEYME
jgi:DNA-damage-inducible protein J